MSFVTKLPLLGRNPAVSPALLSPLPLVFKRDASRLSAIHHGLRRSDKIRPQGAKEIRRSPAEEEYLSPEERRHQRAVARRNPITYKIRKGKKDITEEPGPPRKSKASRFADTRDPFGKRSLVKKFRSGELFEEIEDLERSKGGRKQQGPRDGHLQHDDFVRQMMAGEPEAHDNLRKKESSRSYDAPRAGRSRSSAWGERDHSDRRAPAVRDRGDRFDRSDRGERVNRRSPDVPGNDEGRSPASRSSYRHERTRSDESTSESPYRSHRSTRPDDTNEANDAASRKPRRQDAPVSLPYTTAASQFLYGTSTVEAALATSRRKLYKLYIYKGKDRRSKSLEKDRFIGELARKRGVAVEYVDEGAITMLNKMSGSRPHNGYVLEASPLPQMPIKALREVSEGGSEPGFRVAIGHQSYEETQINGTSEFVPTKPSPRKPLVLMVDEVLDPGNLGAILRTASFMGVTAVAVSKRGSAPVTPVVLKASAGAAETLTMFTVDSVAEFLRESRENGWKVYAAVAPHHGSPRRQVDTLDVEKEDPLRKDPCVLLVGNEGEGLSRELRRASDIEISIPNLSGSDVVDSLNVSVATGLLCSAFLKGKAKKFSVGAQTVQDAGAIF